MLNVILTQYFEASKYIQFKMLQLTAARHERTVAPKQEATFDYRFIPSDAFIGRPVGFVVNLHYTDSAGGYFVST